MTMPPVIHDVIDGLEIFICGLDEQGTILLFNRPCEQLTGVARAAAVGTSWLELFAIGERHDHVRSLWNQARHGGRTGPYEALCQQGRSLRWQFARWDRGDPLPIKLWAVGIDITEERKAMARSRELERVASLANLVSGLTHELRNPLNGALLQLVLAERHEIRKAPGVVTSTALAIGQAAAEIRRISMLLDDFLVFVRPLPMNLERVDVRDIVERSIERGQAKALASGVNIVLEPGPAAAAEVDASRVETAVYQLLANAIDAASAASSREVRVRLDVRENAIAVEVEDHGAGLSVTNAPIFEPFFTTKQGGTGLGLAIVNRVAAEHGGKVSYHRGDGATVFHLVLPIVGGAGN
jgi:PAS domain S-box-containing protein